MIAAVAFGVIAPHAAVGMKPLGDAFIALLRMMLGPIIFCSLVLGLTHISDFRQLGRLAAKSLVYFELISTFAMLLGFVLVDLFRPGVGMHASVATDNVALAKAASGASDFTLTHFLLGIIPTTLVDAFAKGEILQVLMVSALFGSALVAAGPRRFAGVVKGVSDLQELLFVILGFIMRLAPIGAFGAMSAAVGSLGFRVILYLGNVVLLYWGSCLFFVLVVLGLIGMTVRFSIFKLCRLIREEILIVLGTASGEVVLPRLLQKLERAGCDASVVGFVLPAGYSFNLDGTSIYLAIATGFIAQATGTPFTFAQQLGVLAVMLLTSKGGSTVAGAGFVKLAATLQTVRTIPLSGLGLLFGVDRLMSTCTAITNIIGNSMAVFVIAKSEKAFDPAAFEACLAELGKGAPSPLQDHPDPIDARPKAIT